MSRRHMRMVEKPDFARLGDLLPEAGRPAVARADSAMDGLSTTAPRSGLPASELNQRLAAVWAEVVGPEVARNARPVQLREGRLVVTTSSSPWAQTLQLMSEMVIARVNERLGEPAVERVVFRHAGWEDFSTANAPARREKRPHGPAARLGAQRSGAGSVAKADAESVDTAGALEGVTPGAPTGAVEVGPVGEPRHVDPPDEPSGFSEEEKQALAAIERLPLPASAKAAIRDAMKAGFVRARQDFGRL
jgi:Dna[CI] antecedent, DciA